MHSFIRIPPDVSIHATCSSGILGEQINEIKNLVGWLGRVAALVIF